MSALNQLAADRDPDVREAASSGLRVSPKPPPKETEESKSASAEETVVAAATPMVVVESADITTPTPATSESSGEAEGTPSWAQIASK